MRSNVVIVWSELANAGPALLEYVALRCCYRLDGALRNISNTRDSVSSAYPNTEKRVENTTKIDDETLSRVFDISSQSKPKVRRKRSNKIVKTMLIKIRYPNHRHCRDFLCFNLMNY